MKLSDWASIAEIASGVAVVITLVFLIVGIRENTDVVRASAYASSVDSLNEFTGNVFADPELARIWTTMFYGDITTLELADRRRLELMLNVTFRNYEKAYYSDQYGILGQSEWQRFTRQICNNFDRTRALVQWSEEALPVIVSEEFFDYMISTCTVDE
jgi:hypothetical protein